MKGTKLYNRTDKYLKTLRAKIRREFNSLYVRGFDELNVVNTRKLVSEAYRRLKDYNTQNYIKILQNAYTIGAEAAEHANFKTAKAKLGKRDAEKMLLLFLAAYNPVTGYLYNREADRKRARQIEEMLTARELLDRERYNKALKKSADLWYTQSAQYGQDAADWGYKQSLKDGGVKFVKWIAQHDDKACSECLDLDGQIFPIDEVPEKPHYHCRCYLVPVDGEMYRRRVADDGHEIIDKPTYNKLTKKFTKNGGEIIRGAEAEWHLNNMGAYASYFWGVNRAYIRDDATVSEVLEEMYHAEQDRKNMFGNYPSDEILLRREIDAQKYLLSLTDKYKIPKSEVKVTENNLQYYESKLSEKLESKRNEKI